MLFLSKNLSDLKSKGLKAFEPLFQLYSLKAINHDLIEVSWSI